MLTLAFPWKTSPKMAALAVGHVTPNTSSVSSRTYSGKNSPAANFGMRKAQFVRLIHIPVLAQRGAAV